MCDLRILPASEVKANRISLVVLSTSERQKLSTTLMYLPFQSEVKRVSGAGVESGKQLKPPYSLVTSSIRQPSAARAPPSARQASTSTSSPSSSCSPGSPSDLVSWQSRIIIKFKALLYCQPEFLKKKHCSSQIQVSLILRGLKY